MTSTKDGNDFWDSFEFPGENEASKKKEASRPATSVAAAGTARPTPATPTTTPTTTTTRPPYNYNSDDYFAAQSRAASSESLLKAAHQQQSAAQRAQQQKTESSLNLSQSIRAYIPDASNLSLPSVSMPNLNLSNLGISSVASLVPSFMKPKDNLAPTTAATTTIPTTAAVSSSNSNNKPTTNPHILSTHRQDRIHRPVHPRPGQTQRRPIIVQIIMIKTIMLRPPPRPLLLLIPPNSKIATAYPQQSSLLNVTLNSTKDLVSKLAQTVTSSTATKGMPPTTRRDSKLDSMGSSSFGLYDSSQNSALPSRSSGMTSASNSSSSSSWAKANDSWGGFVDEESSREDSSTRRPLLGGDRNSSSTFSGRTY
ncbi:hypothetical protein BDR26DRAFT_864470 [Obelidium mucronatum]|nr:hypothetical protein BDR26DRAFT_864470 [Obelidium mucronatum]